MTFWYETPDDQKNTWHWLGIAISVAYTIGLHRNPEKLKIEPKKKKLRKRIWWSCFMRDRLVALGMMRPIRIQDDAYDVPMLTEEDFEISSTSHNVTIISSYCTLAGDIKAQRQLAQMCISKTKLCTCVSHVLTAQHSFIILARGPQGQDGYSRPDAVPLLKLLDQASEVKRCDEELNKWAAKLPECCLYREKVDPGTSGALVFLQRSLLHMVYFATVSALHRPQLFFSGPTTKRDKYQELRDLSLKKVRLASKEITCILQRLYENRLDRYLPPTGVTVLLPAVIVHLRDIKEGNGAARQTAMDGFCQCMAVLETLKDIYSSAHFAFQLIEAALRKVDIDTEKCSLGPRESVGCDDEPLTVIDDLIEGVYMFPNVSRHTPSLSEEGSIHLLANRTADTRIIMDEDFYHSTSVALTPAGVETPAKTSTATTNSDLIRNYNSNGVDTPGLVDVGTDINIYG